MLPFPTYAPVNYQPGAQPTDQPSPSLRQMEVARLRRAEFVHRDGSRIYMWRFGHFYFANWSDTSMEYGAWSELPGDYQAGELVEL